MNDSIRKSMIAPPVSTSPGVYTAAFIFNSDFPGFRGHFPGRPVLPGVCLLQTALLLASDGSGKSWEISTVKQLKFFRPVLAGETVSCLARLDANGVCRAEFHLETVKVMQVNMELIEP